MSDHELQIQLAELQDRMVALEQLLAQVRITCGQHNCNCVGSQKVKQLANQIIGDTPVTTGRR